MTVRESIDRAADARDSARIAAAEAIRSMLLALEAALGSSRLMGLPKIGSTSTAPYRGLVVRSQRRRSQVLRRPTFGDDWSTPALVLNEVGQLVMASQNTMGDINETPAHVEDLRAEDVECLAETIAIAVQIHAEAAGRKVESYDELAELSRRIVASLEGRD